MEKILKLLEMRGFTQLGFERAAGLPRGRISKWKGGQSEPSLLEGARIAELLRISLDDLANVKKTALPVDDLTEDERLIITVVRKAGLTGEAVIRQLVGPQNPESPAYWQAGSARKRNLGNGDAGSDDKPSPIPDRGAPSWVS